MNCNTLWYKLTHWVFQWRADEEGDITFVIAGIIGFTKYKEHTIIRWFPKLPYAHKHQGANYPRP